MPSPTPDDPAFETGRGGGLLTVGTVQTVVGGIEILGGGVVAVAGVPAAVGTGGAGAFLVPAGGAVAVHGVVTAAVGISNSAAGAIVLASAMSKHGDSGGGETKAPNQPPGRGSTADLAKGTTLPRNVREQMAVEQAMQNPIAGRTLTNVPMNDSRWSASEGWVKKQQVVQSGSDAINVHYNYNTATGAVDDFKIVIRGQAGAAGGGG